MTEERKHAILFAATLLCARKMIENDGVGQAEFRRTVLGGQGGGEGGVYFGEDR